LLLRRRRPRGRRREILLLFTSSNLWRRRELLLLLICRYRRGWKVWLLRRLRSTSLRLLSLRNNLWLLILWKLSTSLLISWRSGRLGMRWGTGRRRGELLLFVRERQQARTILLARRLIQGGLFGVRH
jgi:hypothetical protein